MKKHSNDIKKKEVKSNEFRERIKGITITLDEDENVVLGLEEFFRNYFDSIKALNPPGTIEGVISGILEVTKTETDPDIEDKIVKELYEEYIGGEVSFANLATIVDATEYDKVMEDEIAMRSYDSDNEAY